MQDTVVIVGLLIFMTTLSCLAGLVLHLIIDRSRRKAVGYLINLENPLDYYEVEQDYCCPSHSHKRRT